MTKYEKAKNQVKAHEIADKVMAMSEKDYQRFVKKLQAEISMLDAGVEQAETKLQMVKEKSVWRLGEADGNIVGLGGAGLGLVGGIVACANALSPMDFVDVLIMGTSAVGSAGLGLIAGCLASFVLDENPLGKGIKKFQTYRATKELNKLTRAQDEKNAIMDEICDRVADQTMGY